MTIKKAIKKINNLASEYEYNIDPFIIFDAADDIIENSYKFDSDFDILDYLIDNEYFTN